MNDSKRNFNEIISWLCRNYDSRKVWTERAKEIYFLMIPDYSEMNKKEIEDLSKSPNSVDKRPDSEKARVVLSEEIRNYFHSIDVNNPVFVEKWDSSLNSVITEKLFPPNTSNFTDWKRVADYFLLSASVYLPEIEKRNLSRKKIKQEIIPPQKIVYRSIYYYFDNNEYDFQCRLNELLSNENEKSITDILKLPVVSSPRNRNSLPKYFNLNEILDYYNGLGISQDEPLLIRPCFQGLHSVYKDGKLLGRSMRDFSHLLSITKEIQYENQMGKLVVSNINYKRIVDECHEYTSPLYFLVGLQEKNDISCFQKFGEILDFVPHYTFGVVETDITNLFDSIKRVVEQYNVIPYQIEGLVIRIKNENLFNSFWSNNKNRCEIQYIWPRSIDIGEIDIFPRTSIIRQKDLIESDNRFLGKDFMFYGTFEKNRHEDLESIVKHFGGYTSKVLNSTLNYFVVSPEIWNDYILKKSGDYIPSIINHIYEMQKEGYDIKIIQISDFYKMLE